MHSKINPVHPVKKNKLRVIRELLKPLLKLDGSATINSDPTSQGNGIDVCFIKCREKYIFIEKIVPKKFEGNIGNIGPIHKPAQIKRTL